MRGTIHFNPYISVASISYVLPSLWSLFRCRGVGYLSNWYRTQQKCIYFCLCELYLSVLRYLECFCFQSLILIFSHKYSFGFRFVLFRGYSCVVTLIDLQYYEWNLTRDIELRHAYILWNNLFWGCFKMAIISFLLNVLLRCF